MMQWLEVLTDDTLHEWGNLEMSPASNQHGYLQMEIGFRLKQQLPQGKVFCECSIETAQGVKVADVAWCSEAFLQIQGVGTPFRQAPEFVSKLFLRGIGK